MESIDGNDITKRAKQDEVKEDCDCCEYCSIDLNSNNESTSSVYDNLSDLKPRHHRLWVDNVDDWKTDSDWIFLMEVQI